MGMVIDFPALERAGRDARLIAGRLESATVIILPVVRIERHPDKPSDGLEGGSANASGRRRKRRASRS